MNADIMAPLYRERCKVIVSVTGYPIVEVSTWSQTRPEEAAQAFGQAVVDVDGY